MMKKIVMLLAIAAVTFSCSKDEVTTVESQENLALTVDSDLSTQIPNDLYDKISDGLYAGPIVAEGTDFHGKMWVNLGNDTKYNALIIEDGVRYTFKMTAVNKSGNEYTFNGEIGSFKVNVSDLDDVDVTDMVINGTRGQAGLIKETHGSKIGIILGTFDDAFVAGFTGTFDVSISTNSNAPFLRRVFFTPDGGNGMTRKDKIQNFENGNTQCYTGPNPPFFLNDPLGPSNLYDIYAIGQTWTLPNGMTILYDLGFSKSIQDANGIPYTDAVFWPESTEEFLFAQPFEPNCYWISDTNGFYLVLNAAGDTFVGGGVMTLDTSFLVPVDPPTGVVSTVNEYTRATPLSTPNPIR